MRIGQGLAVALLGPLALLIVSAIVVPGIILFGYSLFAWRFLEPVGEPTLANYVAAASDPLYRQLLINTLAIGVPTTLLSVGGGYALAYFGVFGPGRARAVVFFLIVTALMASYLVRIYAWRTLLGENGIINTALRAIGVGGDRAPDFLLFSRAAAIVAEVSLFMPLAALAFYAALSGIPSDYREAARDLGARPSQVLRRITLPLTGQAVLAVTAVTFFLSAGDYVTPVLVGGVDSSTFGTVIATRMGASGDYGSGAALSFVVLAGFVFAYLALRSVMRAARFLPEHAT
jgi:spermidine/putrescine transport system permease protein